MTLRSQCIQFKTFVSSATTFLASALPAADLSKTKAMDERLLSALGNLLNLDRKSAVGTLLQEGKMPSTLYTWVRERTRVYLEALSTATHNPRILLHRILMRQTAPEYSHPETWLKRNTCSVCRATMACSALTVQMVTAVDTSSLWQAAVTCRRERQSARRYNVHDWRPRNAGLTRHETASGPRTCGRAALAPVSVLSATGFYVASQ